MLYTKTPEQWLKDIKKFPVLSLTFIVIIACPFIFGLSYISVLFMSLNSLLFGMKFGILLFEDRLRQAGEFSVED